MRIVHVVRQFAPSVGGLENYVENLALAQRRAGHEVTVVTLDRIFARPGLALPAEEDAAHGRVVRVPFFGSTRYPIAPGFLRHLRDCDIVHVHAVDFFFDAAAWTRTWHGRPLVVSTHGGFFHTPDHRRLKALFFHAVTRLSLRAYRAVLACSVNDQALFAQISRRPVELVENGVDIEKFRGAGSAAFRKSMVYVGRFARHKRLDRLLDFFAAVRARDPDWSLVVAGCEAELSAADVAALAAERGVADAVRILAGLGNDELRDELGRCSVMASASNYEGFGIGVIEGLSAGLWPVLSDIPAFRRVHDGSGLGLVGSFADPQELAARFLAAVAPLVEDHAAHRARAMAFAEGYAWPRVARRIEAIYRRVLGERVAGGHERFILDVPVSVATRDRAVALLDEDTAAGRRAAVAFLNAHAANVAWRDSSFRRCLGRFRVFNDGVGVDLASRWLYGAGFPENLNGTDFVLEYLRRTRHRHRIFLLGAHAAVAGAAARRLAAAFGRRHEVVGWQHGYFAAAEEAAIVARIRASGATLLLVALGNPRQELWIARHLDRTGCRLGFGVGALFDFVSGATPRAPRLVRLLRLEWVFRLALEPQRLWRRYLIGNVTFLFHVLR